MSSTYSPEIRATTVIHGFTEVDGVKIAYREAGDANSPKLVLFHGWPSSSHQYRNLIPKLADRFHVIAPDYPGFGDSDAPDPETFSYTFDKLAEVIGHFLEQKGFTKFGMYVQDYGGPVGFRVSASVLRLCNGSSFRTPMLMRVVSQRHGARFATSSGKSATQRAKRRMRACWS